MEVKYQTGFGSIFYSHSVVGVNIYSIHTKMGVRTHSAVPLRCVQMHIQLYKYANAVSSGDQFFYG